MGIGVDVVLDTVIVDPSDLGAFGDFDILGFKHNLGKFDSHLVLAGQVFKFARF